MNARNVIIVALAMLFVVAAGAKAEDPVYFPDANLKAEVEEELGIPNPTPTNMLGLTRLHAWNKGIVNLTGIEYATNLWRLILGRNQISDISPLSGLTNLTLLELSRNQISDISPLSGLTKLTILTLGWNNISDISALSGLTNLTYLVSYQNQINDISALTGLTNLTDLWLGQNQISDISPLSGLNKLNVLSVGQNQVSDISALSGLTNLTELRLYANQISDISALSGLTNLTTLLWLGNNQISDISALSGMTNLTELTLSRNQISDISALSGMTNLTRLILRNNQIGDITPLSGMANLTHLQLGNNQISDISSLSGLTLLEKLTLHKNTIVDITALSGMANLTELALQHNQISDISALTEMTNFTKLLLDHNPLSCESYSDFLPLILANNPGAEITYDPWDETDCDSDGVSNSVEDGAPNSGDGNYDGIADSGQNNVASLPNAVDGQYATLESPEGTDLAGVSAIGNPSPGDAPDGVEFSIGFFQFSVQAVTPGTSTTATLFLPPEQTFETYYKYGPTLGNPVDHWYEFLFDGITGAEIFVDRVVLHFVDGQRGDDDLTANGEIVGRGAPGKLSNRPPTADAGSDQTVEQESYAGTEVTLDGSGSTDPDSTEGTNDDIVLFDWYEEETLLGSGEIINYTFSRGSHIVTLQVTDSCGETDEDEVIIVVEDTIPPEISIQTPEAYGLYPVGGLELDFSASDSGSGLSDLWGTLTDAAGYFERVYPGDVPGAGVYTLVVSAEDNAGNYAESEPRLFVVYDPSGGFVTGGGWIESPPGAYVPDPSLTGKANFGFVSKYKKGATEPTGQTEFVFHAGDLNFHSSSYEWLVVTGSDYARFKGWGSINGYGDYGFMLWAGDGPDTFRIRIWEEDESGNEYDLYDNGFDQIIGGGSIVIHAN